MKDTLLCFIQRDTQKVTELSFPACLESTRDYQIDFEHSRSRAALRLIYAASEGRFGSCCSRQSLLRRPMKGRSRACAKMGAHSLARAHATAAAVTGIVLELKNTRRRRRDLRRRSPARMPRRRILGAKFNGRFFFRRQLHI